MKGAASAVEVAALYGILDGALTAAAPPPAPILLASSAHNGGKLLGEGAECCRYHAVPPVDVILEQASPV